MADFEDENFDADEQSGVEAAEEDALYLAEEVDTDDEGDEDAEIASASSTLDEEHAVSEEERARSMMVDMPNPHGSR